MTAAHTRGDRNVRPGALYIRAGCRWRLRGLVFLRAKVQAIRHGRF
jgi:hypothetical protein